MDECRDDRLATEAGDDVLQLRTTLWYSWCHLSALLKAFGHTSLEFVAEGGSALQNTPVSGSSDQTVLEACAGINPVAHSAAENMDVDLWSLAGSDLKVSIVIHNIRVISL